VTYVAVTDQEALDAYQELTLSEGIIPALESAHAVAYVMQNAKEMKNGSIIIINISGRGDKDINIVAGKMGIKL
jgi:tryptophan synthase beta chain